MANPKQHGPEAIVTAGLRIQITPEELESIKELARQDERPLSSYVRKLVKADIKQHQKDIAAASMAAQ